MALSERSQVDISDCGEQGHAMLEFALVLPIIILVFVGTVEFTNFFRIREYMTLVGREAGYIAFRECFDLEATSCKGTDNQIDACLSKHAFTITEALGSRLPGAGLSLSFWKWDPVAEQAELLGITLKTTDGKPTKSYYSDTRIELELKSVMETHEVIVISEVFFPFPFIFDDPNAKYTKKIMPDTELYNVTIF